MNIVLGLLGVLVLLVVLGDVVKTTLTTHGAGLISSRLADNMWSLALVLKRRGASRRLLSYVGSTILVTMIAVWTLLLWLGWSLVFSFDSGSVVLASNGAPAAWYERFYFVGYTLITLGNGEYRPEGAFWQLMTLLASATGFFTITLAITYLLSVLPAVVEKRQLSSYIASLGLTPEEILANHWDHTDCQSLTQHLSTLTSSLHKVAEQHLALPVLHYFHSSDARSALPLRVAALDEALGYLLYGLKSCQKTAQDVRPLRRAVGGLLDTLSESFVGAHDEPPPVTPLTRLKGQAFETKSEDVYQDGVIEQNERRRLLRGYVSESGWEWSKVLSDSN